MPPPLQGDSWRPTGRHTLNRWRPARRRRRPHRCSSAPRPARPGSPAREAAARAQAHGARAARRGGFGAAARAGTEPGAPAEGRAQRQPGRPRGSSGRSRGARAWRTPRPLLRCAPRLLLLLLGWPRARGGEEVAGGGKEAAPRQHMPARPAPGSSSSPSRRRGARAAQEALPQPRASTQTRGWESWNGWQEI